MLFAWNFVLIWSFKTTKTNEIDKGILQCFNIYKTRGNIPLRVYYIQWHLFMITNIFTIQLYFRKRQKHTDKDYATPPSKKVLLSEIFTLFNKALARAIGYANKLFPKPNLKFWISWELRVGGYLTKVRYTSSFLHNLL